MIPSDFTFHTFCLTLEADAMLGDFRLEHDNELDDEAQEFDFEASHSTLCYIIMGVRLKKGLLVDYLGDPSHCVPIVSLKDDPTLGYHW